MTQRWGWAVGGLVCLPLLFVTAVGAAEHRWPWVVPPVLALVYLGCFLRWVLGLGSAGD